MTSCPKISSKPSSTQKINAQSRLPSFKKGHFMFLPLHFFSGNYSCLVATFHLHRSIGFHLIQSYLPSILIVSISWVSFWMDVDCVPARVTLGVITLLTVSSQVSGKQNGSLLVFESTYNARARSDGIIAQVNIHGPKRSFQRPLTQRKNGKRS